MSDLLYRVLLAREDELVNEIHRQILHSTAQHYKDLDWTILLHRIESLVAYFLMSVRETPGVFVDYVAEMSEERIAEGFRLAETLMIMRLLEEKVWLIVVEDISLPGRTAALARVTGIIGAAKDRMAVSYVEHTARHEDAAPLTSD